MILYPKRSSAIWLLVACSAFVVIGIGMAAHGQWFWYFFAAFFGLGVAVAAIKLIPGSTFLRIESEGITFCSLFKQTSIPWSAIEQFFVVTMRSRGIKAMETVGFNYASTNEGSQALRKLAKAIGKSEGMIPDTYGRKAEELAALLNERLRAARHDARAAR